jgi:DNA-directed RNA polymerase subunit K/omega
VETREHVAIDHSELLVKNPNKYELVLKVARRAKGIKDEMARMPGGNETMKPIPLAITEMLAEQAEDAHRM